MSRVVATDGLRKLSTPRWAARLPGTGLPTAGLDHQLAK